MKQRAFVVPNFRVTVRHPEETKDSVLILYGKDAATVTARLQARYPGIIVKHVADYDFAAGWKQEAALKDKAVLSARSGGPEFDFDKNAIWGDLKDFLFDLFDGTCAYCECNPLSGNASAVEHYRPKRPVSGVKDHPGYYWLAYNIENYLPTCTRCNTSKSNRFPVDDGTTHAKEPGKEIDETPLLLNPWKDPPEQHLEFISSGPRAALGPVIKGRSKAGKESINLLKLNRADLKSERQVVQDKTLSAYFLMRAEKMVPNPILAQLIEGRRPFAAACLAAIKAIEKLI